MATPPIDQSKPLDLRGLETRERHGHTEAFCKCGGWVRLGEFYKGDRMVIRQLPHIPICAHYEALLKTGELL
jgi:hypothetical protein